MLCLITLAFVRYFAQFYLLHLSSRLTFSFVLSKVRSYIPCLGFGIKPGRTWVFVPPLLIIPTISLLHHVRSSADRDASVTNQSQQDGDEYTNIERDGVRRRVVNRDDIYSWGWVYVEMYARALCNTAACSVFKWTQSERVHLIYS